MLQGAETGREHGSLLWLLRRTRSAPGGRLLRSWVARPLTRAAAIGERLDAVQELLEEGKPPRASPPRVLWICLYFCCCVWHCSAKGSFD